MNKHYCVPVPCEGTLHWPEKESDACGVGFVAQKDGKKSNRVLRYGLTSVCNVVHRGAMDADLKTGDQPRHIVTRNLLINSTPFVNGVKTGHTLDAGYVLVGSGEEHGTTLISAVLGTPSEAARDADTLELLKYGFGQYKPQTPVVEESHSVKLAARLADAGYIVTVHDPLAQEAALTALGEKVVGASSLEQAVRECDLLIVAGALFLPTVAETRAILGGAAVIAAVGVVDDVYVLGAAPKLLGQVVAASIPVFNGVRLGAFTLPFAVFTRRRPSL